MHSLKRLIELTLLLDTLNNASARAEEPRRQGLAVAGSAADSEGVSFAAASERMSQFEGGTLCSVDDSCCG